MVCSNKGCKIKANISARSGLCQTCEAFVRNANRRMEHQDRQNQSRSSSHDAHRNLHDGDELGPEHGAGPSHAGAPPQRNIFNYPKPNEQALPEVDISEIIKSCEEAKKGNQVDTGKVLSDICGMMVHMFSKQNENEGIKTQVVSNTDRIEQLESKIGDPNDVSYSRSIAIRKLPLPPHGVTELENAQHYLKEIEAEGVDISKDAIKAIRKEAAKHNPNLGPNLGTVLVELRSEEIRGKIMKKKNDLQTHSTQVVRELMIKNALTPAEMKAQNTSISLLKMITGGNNHFIAGNGMIFQKNQNYPHQRFPQQHQAPLQRPQAPHRVLKHLLKHSAHRLQLKPAKQYQNRAHKVILNLNRQLRFDHSFSSISSVSNCLLKCLPSGLNILNLSMLLTTSNLPPNLLQPSFPQSASSETLLLIYLTLTSQRQRPHLPPAQTTLPAKTIQNRPADGGRRTDNNKTDWHDQLQLLIIFIKIDKLPVSLTM